MSIVLLVSMLFSFFVQPTPTPVIPCDPISLQTAIGNASVDFSDGIKDGDELELTFNVLLDRITELKAACVPVKDGIHVKAKASDTSINVGELPDGVYDVTVLKGATLVVSENLFHDNSGCEWDKSMPVIFTQNNTHTLTAKSCDLQIYNTSLSSIEMVFTPR